MAFKAKAYEAYLAQEEGKTILIARASNWPAIHQAMRRMFLAATLGMVLAVPEWQSLRIVVPVLI